MPAGPALAIIWSGNAPPVVMMRCASRCSAACLMTSVTCSTPVVTNSASPSDFFDEASLAGGIGGLRRHRFGDADFYAFARERLRELGRGAATEVVVDREEVRLLDRRIECAEFLEE